jgi:thymidylate synthase
MKVLNVRNAIEALGQGIQLIRNEGEHVDSRGGITIEVPSPVATTYSNPWERVLISKVRDANPFFHLMEAMWILAGREDVKFLTEFNKRMAEYSDDGEVFNAPYGYRLRNGNCNAHLDQLAEVIKLLKQDSNSRQAVCQIWDEDDLVHKTKDKACNMSIVFRIRNGKLCMTVYNRSNDMIWGAYGANVVQFSMIQEYVAAHLGLPLGEYTQVSNSYHIYTEGAGGDVWNRIKDGYDGYAAIYDEAIHDTVYMLPCDMPAFEHDLLQFFNAYDQFGIEELGELRCWQSQYFNRLIMPVLCIYLIHKQHGPEQALKYTHTIQASDWRLACEDWLNNRMEARK